MRWLPLTILAAGFFGIPLIAADTVLVLPFSNESGSQSIDWIGESIAETIREALTSQNLLVLSRDDRLEGYRRLSLRPNATLTHASIIKLGEALDASRVIYGRYAITHAEETQPGAAAPLITPHDSLRISARILDLQHARQSPESGEIGALEDLAALENHLAWQCLKVLALNNAPSEEDFRRGRPTVRLDAMENYVRGLLATSAEQRHRLFTQAVRLDPHFSEPYFQLGKMEIEKKDYTVAAGWLEKVTRPASHYFEANFLLGLCRYQTGDFAGAVKNFEAVAASFPLNEVFNDLGAAQSRLGAPAALDNFHRAAEGDSADPDYQFNLGYASWKRGDFAAAADSFRSLLDRSPDDSEAVVFLGRCLKKEGPHSGDPRTAGRERLKWNFEETAYRELKAALESKH